MVDITHKTTTHRTAIATATLRTSNISTIQAVLNKTVPKGDVLEMAKTAGLFAVKRTYEVIPDCHPLPVEYTKITYDIQELEINTYVEVQTIYKTGVEVEAMHGAAIVALTIYDMLKPIDKKLEIGTIRLIEKTGGKSSHVGEYKDLDVAILVISNAIFYQQKENNLTHIIKGKLISHGITNVKEVVIPENTETLHQQINELATQCNLLFIAGGTGLSAKDKTPETVKPMLDMYIPGIMEAARAYGQQRTPQAMFSRGIAGMIGKTLVITLPGSSRGAAQSIDALIPTVLEIAVKKN